MNCSYIPRITLALLLIVIQITASTGYIVDVEIYGILDYEESITNITITPEGIVNVTITTAIEPGLNRIELPVQPIPYTLTIYIDHEQVSALYGDLVLYVYSAKAARVFITYIADVNISSEYFIEFTINTNRCVNLILPPNAILFSGIEKIYETKIVNGNLIVEICNRTDIVIALRKVEITNTTTALVNPTSVNRSQSSLLSQFIGVYCATILIFFVLVKIVKEKKLLPLIGFKLKTTLEEQIYLDQTDREIIRRLKMKGGSALQSELVRELGIPKTTLWRHIKKLEKLGFIRIVKEGRTNRLYIVKDIE